MKDFSDFFVGESLEPAQHHSGTLVVGQLANHGSDSLLQFAFRDSLCWIGGLGVSELRADFVAILGLCHGIERLGAAPGATAVFIEDEVMDDGDKPGGEFSGRFVAFGGAPDLNENALRKVFRLPGIADAPINCLDDAALVTFDEFPERLTVALPDALHQLGIGIDFLHHLTLADFLWPSRSL